MQKKFKEIKDFINRNDIYTLVGGVLIWDSHSRKIKESYYACSFGFIEDEPIEYLLGLELRHGDNLKAGIYKFDALFASNDLENGGEQVKILYLEMAEMPKETDLSILKKSIK